jgi:hypothetical protein
LFGSFDDFDEVAVKDNVVRSYGVICPELERQVIQEEHHAYSVLAEAGLHSILDDLPDFSIALRGFQVIAELANDVVFVFSQCRFLLPWSN